MVERLLLADYCPSHQANQGQLLTFGPRAAFGPGCQKGQWDQGRAVELGSVIGAGRKPARDVGPTCVQLLRAGLRVRAFEFDTANPIRITGLAQMRFLPRCKD
jgi:hypothetical protein